MELELSSTSPGLNVQSPWARYIIGGLKTIETRTYPLPVKYIEKELLIVETPGDAKPFPARVIGSVVFGKAFLYQTEAAFYEDSERHLITPATKLFNWSRDIEKWGWPVLSVRQITPYTLPPGTKRGIIFSTQLPKPSGSSWIKAEVQNSGTQSRRC